MSFFTNTGASSTGDAAKQPGPSFGAPNTGGSIFGGGVSSTTGTGSLFGNPQPVGGNIFGGGNATPSAPASSSTGSGVFGNSQNNTNSGSTSTFGTTGNIFGISNNSASTPAAGGNIFGTPNTSTPLPAGGSFGAGAGGSGGGSNSIFGASNNASSSNTTSNPSTNAGSSIFGSGSAFSKPADGGAKPTPTTSIFGQPSAPSTTSAATTTGGNGLFVLPAKPAATTTTPAPTTTAGGGGFFNPSNDSKQPATTSTTPGSTATVNGLFNLNAKPATSPAPATGTSSTSSTTGGSTLFSGGGIFGQKPATTPAGGYSTATAKEGEKKDGTAPTPFNLFGGAKSIEKKDDTSSKDGEKKDTTATTSSTGASSTPAAIAVQPPSMLRGKSIEEIVNKWSADLETNVRDFNKFAAEVAVWDRALIENGNNIAALFSHVVAAERQQNDINESLSHIEQQQKELATTLDSYERISQDILGGQGGSLRTLDTGPADNERDKNYMLATDLHTHLDDLSGSLTQMIESVNALSIASKPADSADDPMSQISTILSSHLESLQWVDNAVREVEGKTNEIEHRIKDSGHSLSGSKSRGFGLNR